METRKILSSALVGTTAMTVFSLIISAPKNKNFSEPANLSQLIKKLPETNLSKSSAAISGWLAHYAIGIIFVAFYNELWKTRKVKPTLTSGALLGIGSGLAGIAAWQGMFKMHPNPPKKNLKKYFGHLLLAHIVFGVFSTITYKLVASQQSPDYK